MTEEKPDMVKWYVIVFTLAILSSIFLVLLYGCTINVAECRGKESCPVTTTLPTCYEPYFRVGLECCLDLNSNQICDRDEQ